MINISNTIKNSCKADTNTHTEYIVINGQTIYIKGKLNATAYKDTTFFGTFNMKVLEFETENTTQFRNREFEYYKVIDGNAFKVGTFITTEVVDNDSDENIKVTANDYALKFAVPYTSELDYGSGEITLYDVLEECCNQVGVELENKLIDNNNFIVDSNQFVNGELVGDVICAIAGISGNFATITNEDKLRLTFTNGTGNEQTATIDGSTKINASELKSIELLPKTTQETTTGKNMLNPIGASQTLNGITFTNNGDGTFTANGTATANVTFNLTNLTTTPINLNANQSYTQTLYVLSGTWGGSVVPAFKNGGGTITYNYFNNNASNPYQTKTPTENMTCHTYYYYVGSGTSVTNCRFRVQLEKGTFSDSPYEPYTGGIASPNPNYPQNIETITGENTIKVVNKNLFNPINLDYVIGNDRYTKYGNGIISNIPTAMDWASSTPPMNANPNASQKNNVAKYGFLVEPNTQYTFSFDNPNLCNAELLVFQYDKDFKYIRVRQSTQSTNTKHTFTITSDANTKYMMVRFDNESYSSGAKQLNVQNIMLEKGSTATTYEPYQNQTYELNLGKNLLPPVYQVDGTNISVVNATLTMDDDEFVFTATGSDMYFGQVLSSGNTYTGVRGVLIDVSGMSAISFTLTNDSFTNNYITAYDSSKTSLGYTQIGSARGTYNIPSNAKYISFRFGIANAVSGTTYKTKVQIEKGAIPSDYTPYFEPIEYCKIGNYEDKFIKTTGKNLFNKETAQQGYYYTTTSTPTSNNWYIQQVKVEPNTSYYLSGNNYNNSNAYIVLLDENKNIISSVGAYPSVHLITTSSTTAYIGLSIADYSGTGDLNTIMLEKGSTATSYEPYGKNEWWLKKAIGKATLDSTYRAGGGTTGTNAYYLNTNIVAFNDNTKELSMSNMFQPISFNNRANGLDTTYVQNGTLVLRTANNTSIDWSDNTKRDTWLNANKPIVYYVLATPTYTKLSTEIANQLDDIQLIHLFDGINNISTDIPLNISYLDGNIEILEDYTQLEDKRDTQPITSVSIGTSQVEGQEAILRDESLIAQYGEHWLVINDNPFGYTLDKRQQLVGAIFDKVKGFGYSSFKSEYTYRPYLELGDKIKFKNKNGDLIDSAILRYNFEFDNCTFEAPSITSATIDYELSPDADEKAKRAEIIANQAEASITSITQELQMDEDGNSQVIESIKTTQTQNSLDIEAITSYEDIDGVRTLTGVKTSKGFTFNSQGLIIQSNENTYKAIHNEMGDYYYDGDTPLGETTNEGSKFKNMDLYGEFRYGKDDIDDPALFVSMKYEDDGEECFGHFWNGD